MKVNSKVCAGQVCAPLAMEHGTVEQATGGGFYGVVRDNANQPHYFNVGYTAFLPAGRGVTNGEQVLFAPYAEGPRRGKVAQLWR
ncbi:MAG TPA: hypothetical protein VLS48_03220 [Anaerolineales bacterium]|nr:hypothetical protein [Anaerolineales bacterium]